MMERWVGDPLAVVQELIENGSCVREVFEQDLHSSESSRLKVPLLTSSSLQSLPHHSLVRFRCMIQDQFDPEFYFKVYHVRSSADVSRSLVTCSGLYRDINHHPVDSEIDFDHPSNVTGDRQTLYCVPIPGETPWVKDMYEREGEVNAVAVDDSMEVSRPKRSLSDTEEDDGELSTLSKKPRSDQAPPTSSSGTSQTVNFNFPLPWEDGTPCLVKVYEDFEQHKVASCVEVYGVLSKDPALAQIDQLEFGEETVSEQRAHCPPPSLIPRLHAITVHHMSHNNPLLSWQLKCPIESKELVSEIQASRKLLVKVLADVLMGDKLAAEFILLHLLSSVHGRTELLALGKFALNLSNCSPQVVSNLKHLFELLLSKSVYLPLSLEKMNEWKFSPKKDYTANRLTAGLLQLTDGSHLLADETALTAGQLSEVGVRNLTALGNVIQWQKLNYDFQYHTSEFHTDLQVLIASEGKSILQVDCHVPLDPLSTRDSQLPSLSNVQLTQLRKYLSLQRLSPYSITQQVQKGLEEDFVCLRQSDFEMTSALFQYLLSLSRLMSLSYGCDHLTLDLWSQVKHMDNLRRQRLEKRA